MRTTHVLATALLAAVPLVGASTAQAAPAAAEPAGQVAGTVLPAAVSAEGALYAETILARVNELRASLGLDPVTRYVELDTVAQEWSEQMVAQDVLAHRPSFSEAYPSGWSAVSENVAMRQDALTGDIGGSIFEQWLNSPGHYANMTDPGTNAIGIGIAYDASTGSWYATQNFATYSEAEAEAAGLTPAGSASTTTTASTSQTEDATPAQDAATEDTATEQAPAAPTTDAATETAQATATATDAPLAYAATESPAAVAATGTTDDVAERAVVATVAAQTSTRPNMPATGASLAAAAVALAAVTAGVIVLRLRRRA
ncbi:MAG: CAP domain-containing protein [Actinomyces sp.]|uniref:CAP domain-containing protein n=1 Tax=Actinomyces sp. TaxID=29317 RepID=UPI0026DB77FD|nr:CAP domain-containing protein [Actinomyces sp.]MDO4243250.1 CAP domain-containing protein [Actinomyces sp.]